MIKIILVALPTAVLAFAAGVWAEGERHPKHAVAAVAPLTISPSEMERNLKPDDLPAQYMERRLQLASSLSSAVRFPRGYPALHPVMDELGTDELYPLTPLSALGIESIFESAEAMSAK